VRTVFVIGPDKKIKLMLVYTMTTGRNFDEVLRVLDSMQLTAKRQVAPGECDRSTRTRRTTRRRDRELVVHPAWKTEIEVSGAGPRETAGCALQRWLSELQCHDYFEAGRLPRPHHCGRPTGSLK